MPDKPSVETPAVQPPDVKPAPTPVKPVEPSLPPGFGIVGVQVPLKKEQVWEINREEV
jgi:hypothetical protein